MKQCRAMNLFSTNFVQSKYRSIVSDENLASELGCVVHIKYTRFKTILKKDVKYLINNFLLIAC